MGALEDKPYIVSWNLTKRCNLLCPHCYIEALNAPNPELSESEAKFVIDELSYLNSRLMLVLSGGEPMLRKDIYDIVDYASHSGFITVLGSNGTLLTGENIKLLRDAGLKGVGISIDSTVPESHDSFRGLSGAWELSVSALRAAREAGLETQLDVTLTDQNWKEIDSFLELGVGLRARAVNFFFLVCTGRAMSTNISTENYDSAIQYIAELLSRERRLMVRARCAPHIYRILHQDGFPVPDGTRGCLAGRSYMRIDPEGNVTPCPYMPLTVGNIKEKSLTSIWEDSSILKQLRQETYKGRCGLCEFAEICGGCRARALLKNNDIMEEDPLCTYTPSDKATITFTDTFKADLQWEERAKERIKRIPLFMRGMITRVIEAKAMERGIGIITSEFIDEIKMQGYPGMHRNHNS
jgi:radical SAM protein with 4Fe4S-binding SPASM domain